MSSPQATSSLHAHTPTELNFWDALKFWFKLGWISFGGPAGQIALMHKTRGGIAAGVLFVLPSLFLLMGLSWLYIAYGQVTWVAELFYGIKPAVTAIVLQAAYRIGSRTLKNNFLWAVAAASFVAILALSVPLLDIASACMAVGATMALFKYKRNVMHVIAMCGFLGMAVHALLH